MGSSDLSILLIGDSRSRISVLTDGLREAGHCRLRILADPGDATEMIATEFFDAVVITLGSPEREQLEPYLSLCRTAKRPVAMFVDSSDAAAIEAAVQAGISAFVIDGLRKERVKPILAIAISRFNAHARLHQELAAARAELEDRKIIEQAKRILMRMRGIGEQEAYALLRRTAMNQNRKLTEIASSLIAASGLLEQ